jgi:hypothetical protein
MSLFGLEFTFFKIMYAMIWLGVFLSFFKMFIRHGSDFITWPRLLRVRTIQIGPDQAAKTGDEKKASFTQNGLYANVPLNVEVNDVQQKLRELLPPSPSVIDIPTNSPLNASIKGNLSQAQQRPSVATTADSP